MKKLNESKICFITCVNDQELYNESLAYIENLNLPENFEIETMWLSNANSITSAYNQAMKATDAKYKVYLHQDVFITNKNFILNCLEIFTKNKNIGMIGMAGARKIPFNAIWWESDYCFGKIADSHTGSMEIISFNEIKNDFEQVDMIDGVVIITQYDVDWREDLFDGWHFYDLSQSMEFKKAGYDIVVPKQDNIWCIHDSGVPLIKNGFEEYRKIFVEEYLTFYKSLNSTVSIAFIEANNIIDLSANLSMAYQQIKAFLLKYSKYKDNIDMFFAKSIEEIPSYVDIIGISTTSQNYFECTKLVKIIRGKFPSALIVMGGHHISYFPKMLPAEVDIGVLFEGEETFTNIVDCWIERSNKHLKLEEIKGICYHNENGISVNEFDSFIMPLDKIPFPLFEDNSPYIFSSRGCPYRCSFCSSQEFWKKYRTFSVEYVISEIEYIIEQYPLTTYILFWDDLVIADRKRFREIVRIIDEKGLNKKISYSFAVRANLVDEEICQLLKKINVSYVTFGAESGDDRILNMLKGDSVSVEINQRALNLLSKYNIPVNCNSKLNKIPNL